MAWHCYFMRDMPVSDVTQFSSMSSAIACSGRYFTFHETDPYSTFSYQSRISFYVYLTFNCAYIILLFFTRKCNTFNPKCGNMYTYLSYMYIQVPLPGYDVLDTDYGFYILRENNCDFAN